MKQEVVMVCGLPASGKGTLAQEYINEDYVWLNRDNEGGRVVSLVPKLERHLAVGRNVVLDNTFISTENRRPFIEACEKASVPIRCLRMGTSKLQAHD